MKPFIHLLILISFCLWLIPLGQFIKKDRQDALCGGQRAFCMCYAPLAKKGLKNPVQGILNLSSTVNQKEAPGVMGPQFDVMEQLKPLMMNKPLHLPLDFVLPILLVAPQIEHVPKV